MYSSQYDYNLSTKSISIPFNPVRTRLELANPNPSSIVAISNCLSGSWSKSTRSPLHSPFHVINNMTTATSVICSTKSRSVLFNRTTINSTNHDRSDAGPSNPNVHRPHQISTTPHKLLLIPNSPFRSLPKSRGSPLHPPYPAIIAADEIPKAHMEASRTAKTTTNEPARQYD